MNWRKIMKRSICIDGKIFEYDLTYKKIKNLNLRIRPNGAITVSAPMRFPVKKIDTFVIGKSDFITSALERFENIRKLYNFQGLREGNELFVLGEPYRIKRELANSIISSNEEEIIKISREEILNGKIKTASSTDTAVKKSSDVRSVKTSSTYKKSSKKH